MRLRKNRVHLQEVPNPGNSMEEKQHRPTDGTVDNGGGNGRENTKKTCWKRVTSLFKCCKKHSKVTSGQAEAEQPQNEAVKSKANDDISSPSPKPGAKAEEQLPHPPKETPVDAGEPKSNEKVKKKKKKWWRLGSLFKALKKPKEMPPAQEEEEQQEIKEEKNAVFSDEYILSRYELGDELGEGAFGVVHAAKRLEDGLKVAVKYVKKIPEDKRPYLHIPGCPDPLPVELALTIMANTGPKVPEIIELLDWKDFADHYIMVFECPTPCENLSDYVKRMGGTISESLARTIVKQVIRALVVCFEREVFHRDVKLSNILFNEETHEVKLIDFGCGDVWNKCPYLFYCGTQIYSPPEFYILGKYLGKPATVWSLGILLFRLVCGSYPTTVDLHLINFHLWTQCGLSNDFCKLIRSLLQVQPNKRIGLGNILSQGWFKNN